jgi:hypothetical protein
MDVRLPDGTILSNVPDGITQTELVNTLTKNGMGHLFATAADKKMADPTGSFGENALAGAGKAFADMGRGVKQIFGADNQTQIDESRKLDAPLMRTGGGMTGNIGANIGMAVPAMMVPGANTVAGAGVLGAVQGGLNPVATGESRGTNMMVGGTVGAGSQVAGNLLGRAIRPVRSELSPELERLAGVAQQQNIPLSAGQRTGSRPLQIMESVFENLPFTSGPQLARRQAQGEAYNAAIGRTFGQNADAITPDVLGTARREIGQQFTNLAGRNTLDANNNRFLTQLANATDEANRFATPDVARVVTNRVDDLLSKVDQNGRIPGQAYREFDSALGRTMRGSSNGDLRSALGDVRHAAREGMDNSISQADQAAWRDARRQYANLMTVAPVAARSESGNVSGKTLLGATNTGNRNARFGGPSDLADIARVGRAFVSEQIPNSGTAQRALYQGLLTGGLGGAGYAASDDPSKGIALGLLGLGGPRAIQAAMNSRAGQRYLTNGLLHMTPRQQEYLQAMLRGGLLTQAVQQ